MVSMDLTHSPCSSSSSQPDFEVEERQAILLFIKVALLVRKQQYQEAIHYCIQASDLLCDLYDEISGIDPQRAVIIHEAAISLVDWTEAMSHWNETQGQEGRAPKFTIPTLELCPNEFYL